MAFKLSDITDIFKDINLFPASGVSRLEKFTRPEYGGLLSAEDVAETQKRANLGGLLATAIGTYAAPKNKGAGSILPYIAEQYLTKGMPTAGNVGDVALSSLVQGQKFKQIANKNLLTQELLKDPRVQNDPASKLMAYENPAKLYDKLNETIVGRAGSKIYQRGKSGQLEEIASVPSNKTVKPLGTPSKGDLEFYDYYIAEKLGMSTENAQKISPYIASKVDLLQRANPNLSANEAADQILNELQQSGAISQDKGLMDKIFGTEGYKVDMSKTEPKGQYYTGQVLQDANGNMAIVTGIDAQGNPILEEYNAGE